jgi:hypothetical protein
MRVVRSGPKFDHGAALRVPPAHDANGRRALWQWLGENGCPLDDRGAVQVSTREGPAVARPGDWIVLSYSGALHVARGGSAWDS